MILANLFAWHSPSQAMLVYRLGFPVNSKSAFPPVTRNFLLLTFGAVFSLSCLAQTSTTNGPKQHSYTVSAEDAEGQPLEGVTVTVKFDSGGEREQVDECVTDTSGQCPPLTYEVHNSSASAHFQAYRSKALAQFSKEGFFSAVGEASTALHSSYYSFGKTDIQVKLYRPTDFLDERLRDSVAHQRLRERALVYLAIARPLSRELMATPMPKGIGVSEFKGRKYLHVRLNSLNTYNTLKVGKYEHAREVFDNVVRKSLTPLHGAVATQPGITGYDVVVEGSSKDFSKKHESANTTEFRFLMPEKVIRQYLDKDISGQKLLDASVVLFDGERVDLKLQ